MKFINDMKADSVKAIISEENRVFSVNYALRYEFYNKGEFVLGFTRYAERSKDLSTLFYELANNGFINLLGIDLDKDMDNKTHLEFKKTINIQKISIYQSDYGYIITCLENDKSVFYSLSYEKDEIIRLITQLV